MAYAETVVYGETEPYCCGQRNLMAYFRRGERCLLVAGNFQKEVQDMPMPGPMKKLLLNNMDKLELKEKALRLEGWQFVVMEI